MGVLVVTERDLGRLSRVDLAGELQIHLPEKPTTGFQWQLVSAVEPLLTLRNSEPIAPTEAQVGGEGYHQFIFQANRKGKLEIAFELRRSWSGETIKSVSFLVEVG